MKQTIKLIFYYFAYQLLFAFLAGGILSIAGLMDGTMELENLSYEAGRNVGLTTGLAMVLSGLAMTWHLVHYNYVAFNKETWRQVPLKNILLSIPFIVSALFISNMLTEVMDLPNLMEDTFIQMSHSVAGFISLAIMAPLVEELLFRGAIEGHFLHRGMRPKYAILVSALIFGIIHLNPMQIPFAFFIGLIFGWLYWRTGSVIPGMIGHFLNNTVASLVMLFSTPEEMEQTTADYLGVGPAYALFALAVIVFIGMFFYLNKSLPAAPEYAEEATDNIV